MNVISNNETIIAAYQAERGRVLQLEIEKITLEGYATILLVGNVLQVIIIIAFIVEYLR